MIYISGLSGAPVSPLEVSELSWSPVAADQNMNDPEMNFGEFCSSYMIELIKNFLLLDLRDETSVPSCSLTKEVEFCIPNISQPPVETISDQKPNQPKLKNYLPYSDGQCTRDFQAKWFQRYHFQRKFHIFYVYQAVG